MTVLCPACGAGARMTEAWMEWHISCPSCGKYFYAPDKSCRNRCPVLPAPGIKWERAEIA